MRTEIKQERKKGKNRDEQNSLEVKVIRIKHTRENVLIGRRYDRKYETESWSEQAKN